jgi:ParB/RepB/Spo0J family partition protein
MAKTLALLGTLPRREYDKPGVIAKRGERQLPGALIVERRRIQPDPDQPRKDFSPERLQELADNIKAQGILLPLRVRPNGDEDGYIIVSGERRWRAAGLADVNELPVLVVDSPADDRAFEMLTENLIRQDLSIQEEAAGYRRLIEQRYTESKIAERLGVSVSRISRALAIYQDGDLGPAVASGQISKSEAADILPIPVKEERQAILRRVVAERSGGKRVTRDRVRAIVREHHQDVMESFAPRKDEHNETPRTDVDRAVKNVIDKLYGLPGHYPGAVMSARVSEELDAAIAAVVEWRDRNGTISADA